MGRRLFNAGKDGFFVAAAERDLFACEVDDLVADVPYAGNGNDIRPVDADELRGRQHGQYGFQGQPCDQWLLGFQVDLQIIVQRFDIEDIGDPDLDEAVIGAEEKIFCRRVFFPLPEIELFNGRLYGLLEAFEGNWFQQVID